MCEPAASAAFEDLQQNTSIDAYKCTNTDQRIFAERLTTAENRLTTIGIFKSRRMHSKILTVIIDEFSVERFYSIDAKAVACIIELSHAPTRDYYEVLERVNGNQKIACNMNFDRNKNGSRENDFTLLNFISR